MRTAAGVLSPCSSRHVHDAHANCRDGRQMDAKGLAGGSAPHVHTRLEPLKAGCRKTTSMSLAHCFSTWALVPRTSLGSVSMCTLVVCVCGKRYPLHELVKLFFKHPSACIGNSHYDYNHTAPCTHRRLAAGAVAQNEAASAAAAAATCSAATKSAHSSIKAKCSKQAAYARRRWLLTASVLP